MNKSHLTQSLLQQFQILIKLLELPTPCTTPLRQHLQHHIIILVLSLQQVIWQSHLIFHTLNSLGLREASLILLQQLLQHFVLLIDFLHIHPTRYEWQLHCFNQLLLGDILVPIYRQKVNQIVINILPDFISW